MHPYAGYVFIFIAALCWSFLGVFGRVAMDAGLAPIDVAFWRALFGGVFLLIHSFFLKDLHLHSLKDALSLTLFGVFSIAVFFVSYQYAVRDGGVALASVLLYTAPAWVALFSRIFFGLLFTRITCFAIILSLLGVTFISFSGMPNTTTAEQNVENSMLLYGILFGLLAGFLYATHFIMTKKYLTVYTPFTLYAYGSLVAALCLFPFITLRFDIPIRIWLALLGIGFISTYIAYWAYGEGVKRLHPTKAAVFATLEPVITTIAAWFIWGESFSLWGWFGAILILCTVFILLLNDHKKDAH